MVSYSLFYSVGGNSRYFVNRVLVNKPLLLFSRGNTRISTIFNIPKRICRPHFQPFLPLHQSLSTVIGKFLYLVRFHIVTKAVRYSFSVCSLIVVQHIGASIKTVLCNNLRCSHGTFNDRSGKK